jgi:ATP/maltotriose-dependent transcriptional regulator MalT
MLERDAELAALAHAVREAADRHGSVVLVKGEAGIGKSSLVEALRSHLPAEGRMLVGYCDDLAAPRTLGPFRDLVGSVGTELSRAVTDGSERDRVLTALRTELTWPEHPTVLVIEDVHWADDATLDALRYLIRRIADLPAVLVLTYRDDELNREHPLQAAAEERGLLSVSTRKIAFRHELTRHTIADAVPAARLMALNQRVLDALIDHDGSDVARIVHHAAQAGDLDAIIRYGPVAGRDAAGAGAHREAVAHFGLVLEHQDRFAPGERAELLAQYAIECYTIGAIDKAVEAGQHAVEESRSLDYPRPLGSSLRWLSRIWWMAGNRANAEQAGQEAISVLERAGDSRLLALALSNESQLCMLAHRLAESVEYGERAATLAREVGDAAVMAHALTNIGIARWVLGDPAGQSLLDEALRVALEAGDVEDACRAYVGLVWHLLNWFRLDEAERYLTAAMKLAEETEFFGILSYMQAARARLEFARGSWDEATRVAEAAADAFLPARCPALIVLGRVHVRRGQPQAARLLASAWELAVQINELQRLGPAAAAHAEDAWLRGDQARVLDIATPVYTEASRLDDPVHQAELGYWLTKAGQPAETGSGHPYALQAAGRWREAAEFWQAAGCPYEHAAALAESPEPGDLLASLEILDELGATPLATLVRGRLRALGTTRIPRGPRGETRVNPAGLTTRQVEVLRLLGMGYTNAQIASQLVVSVRTVDSNVAAVLAKLGAASRREAAASAAQLGVLDAENR